MWGKNATLLILFILFIPISSAINVNPSDYTIDNPEINKKYNVIITLINTDINTYDIEASLSDESAYLKEHVNIEPSDVSLKANDKKNVKLSFTVPENISPQNHTIQIDFKSSDQTVANFKLFFEIKGNQEYSIDLDDVSVNAKDTQSPVHFTLQAENTGNTITQAMPIVNVFKDDDLIKTLGNKSRIRLMPSENKNLSLLFDPSNINEQGDYNYEAYFAYADDKTESIKGKFHLNKVKRETNKKLMEIKKGSKLKFPVKIDNPSDSFSFYRIDAKIDGTNISRTLEGSINNASKVVNLELNTNSLEDGSYPLVLKIAKGKELEDLTQRKYTLVISSSNKLWLIAPAAFLIAFLIIFLKRDWLPLSVFNLEKIKIKSIKRQLKGVDKKYDKIEKDIVKMGKEVNKFIENTNNWLDKYSEGSTRFK